VRFAIFRLVVVIVLIVDLCLQNYAYLILCANFDVEGRRNDDESIKVLKMKKHKTYRLKERNISLRDKYKIENEEGDTVYEIKGKWWSWGDKLTVKNQEGVTCLMIDQKQLALRPKYSILRNEEKVAEVSKKISLFKQKLEIEFEDGKEYAVKGNFLDREFEFKDGQKTIAEVSKKWLSLSDTYGVRIAEGEDAEVILAAVVIIDLMLQEEEGDE